MNTSLKYQVFYSAPDQEWVGTCEQFPSLSWLAEDPTEALNGIIRVSEETLNEIEKGSPKLRNSQEKCPRTKKPHLFEMGEEPFTYYCYDCGIKLT